jgi:hypothetical protein
MSTDDDLRDMFEKGIEPIEAPEDLAEQLAGRTAEAIAAASGGAGGITVPIIVAIAAAGGLIVGGLLGIFGGSGPQQATTLAAAPIYACPGTDEVGTLHRGDRVVMIGQSGDWIAVRNVRGSLERVFINKDHVTADDETANLPRADCDENGVLVVAGDVVVATTTTTLPPETTTTTLDPGAQTTSSTSTTSTTTTKPTTSTSSTSTSTSTTSTSTTTQPDTTAPVISQQTANPGEIWEQDGQGISCTASPPYPRQATISATVTDNTGVATVTASWDCPSGSQTIPMTKSGTTYSATFGPFPAESWATAQVNPYTVNVSIAIDARDEAGNKVTQSVSVTVNGIASCFI